MATIYWTLSTEAVIAASWLNERLQYCDLTTGKIFMDVLKSIDDETMLIELSSFWTVQHVDHEANSNLIV